MEVLQRVIISRSALGRDKHVNPQERGNEMKLRDTIAVEATAE